MLSFIAKSFRTAFLLGALAAAASPGLAQAATTVKLGTVTWIGYGPFYVADKLDLYKKYGLKVVLQNFTDPALIPSAMASKSVDGGMLTYDQVIGAVANGQPFKVVMPIDYSNGGDAIVATTSVTKVADFKGKKVAFNPLSPSDFLLSYALKKNGMTDSDVQPVNMTPEAIPAAMASGTLPIGVTYEPSVSQILASGGGKKFHVVFSSKEAPGLITDVLVFDTAYIKAHPTEIKGIIQGYVDALAFMKSKPDEAAKIIGKALGVSAKEVKEQMTGVYNIPLAEMPKNFMKAKETTSFYASGEVIGQILLKKEQIKKIPATEDTFDQQFVKMLVK
jgi:NitT/TauT family transport system substrate-binding protein